MADLQSGDKFLVSRSNSSYQVDFDTIKEAMGGAPVVEPPAPSHGDLWVDTDECPPVLKIYIDPNECDPNGDGSGTGWEEISSGGGGGDGSAGDANPRPGFNVQHSGGSFVTGAGSEGDPYILDDSVAFLAGMCQTTQTITLYGLNPGDNVVFSDLNGADNQGRFTQPIGAIGADGKYIFRLLFEDRPNTAQGDAPKTYTAKLKCGQAHWQWNVEVQPKGVEKPIITNLTGTDGASVSAPTAPLFDTTAGPVGTVIFEGGEPTGLTGATPELTPTPISASGSGLKLVISANSSNTVGYVGITNPGRDYTYGDTVSVDLSSIGGDSAVVLRLAVQPVSGASVSMEVSAYQAIGAAGAFSKMVAIFSEDPNFASGVVQVESNSNSTTQIFEHGLDPYVEYYMRVKYVAADGTESAYSDTVRSATSGVLKIKHVLNAINYHWDDASPTTMQTWESPNYKVSPQAGQYLSIFVDGQNGLVEGDYATPGWPVKTEDARAMYLVTRQQARWRVSAKDGAGVVQGLEPLNTAWGLNDYFADGQSVKLNTNGGGTDLRVQLRRDPSDGHTIIESIDNKGTGYQVNDEVWFTPNMGNASQGQNGVTVDNVELDTNDTLNTGYYQKSMDSSLDILIHGVGSNGGRNGKGGGGRGYGGVAYLKTSDGQRGQVEPAAHGSEGQAGAAGVISGSLYPGKGGHRQDYSSGGPGWGAGGASQGEYSGSSHGGGAGATYLEKNFVSDADGAAGGTTTSDSAFHWSLLINGDVVANVSPTAKGVDKNEVSYYIHPLL